MVRNCCVPQCENVFEKGSSMKLHLFPFDDEDKKKWIHVLKMDRKPSSAMVVCSDHFNSNDYVLTKQGIPGSRLKPHIIPSLKLPKTKLELSGLVKIKPKRKSPTKRLFVLESSHESHRSNSSPSEILQNVENPSQMEDEPPSKRSKLDNVQITLDALDLATVKSVSNRHDAQTQTTTDLPTIKRVLNTQDAQTQALLKQNTIQTQTRPSNNSKKTQTSATLIRHSYLSLQSSPVQYLTGLDRPRFEAVFEMMEKLNPISDNIVCSRKDCLLFTLFKYRHNLDFKMIEFIFDIARNVVSDIFKEVTEKLYFVFKQIDIWNYSFKHPKCYRSIVDCTEFKVARIDDPRMHQLTYSHYKSGPTFKNLISCDEKAAVNLISETFGGSITDKDITMQSGILSKLKPGEALLADRGFDISDLVEEKGIILNIPPFLKGKTQLSQYEVMKTRIIANRRILIENINCRAKKNKILFDPMPLSLWPLANKIIFICFSLVNFYKPLVK